MDPPIKIKTVTDIKKLYLMPPSLVIIINNLKRSLLGGGNLSELEDQPQLIEIYDKGSEYENPLSAHCSEKLL